MELLQPGTKMMEKCYKVRSPGPKRHFLLSPPIGLLLDADHRTTVKNCQWQATKLCNKEYDQLTGNMLENSCGFNRLAASRHENYLSSPGNGGCVTIIHDKES